MCSSKQHTPLLCFRLVAELAGACVCSSRLNIYLLTVVLLQVPWLQGCNFVVRDTAANCLERLDWASFFVLICAELVKCYSLRYR